MGIKNYIEICLFIVLLSSLSPLVGTYLYNIYEGKWTGSLEKRLFPWLNINRSEEMSAQEYIRALLIFNTIGFITLFAILLLQYHLPLNPQGFEGLNPALAFNVAISFVTNTNWQSYTPETTLSYFSQMVGLTTQNFLSAATGAGCVLALSRGLSRKMAVGLGSFWVDLSRTILYVLLPLSCLFAFFLVTQGVIQTFSPYVQANTLDMGVQTIPLGPVASQEAIKMIGTNGGGFFNANSAHPFENPNGLTDFLENFMILLLPAGFVFAYAHYSDSCKHAWLLYIVMLIFWLGGLGISILSEKEIYPFLEGKELRLGVSNSILWATATTSASNGSVNNMLESLAPLSGGIALFNIMIGEQIFGGIGVGLASMIMFVILTVFIAGLMVGRTPEYLGKKIEKREMQRVIIAVLIPTALILIGSAIAFSYPKALESLGNTGPKGFSEILYAFSSAAGNNGSAFMGLNANTDFYNISLGLVMLIARLAILIPSISLAGLLVRKKIAAPSIGTFGTDNWLFASLLIVFIIIVAAICFFPALSLGPILEHLLLKQGGV